MRGLVLSLLLAAASASTNLPKGYQRSTVIVTSVITISDCGPEVLECPYHNHPVTMSVTASYETISPVTTTPITAPDCDETSGSQLLLPLCKGPISNCCHPASCPPTCPHNHCHYPQPTDPSGGCSDGTCGQLPPPPQGSGGCPDGNCGALPPPPQSSGCPDGSCGALPPPPSQPSGCLDEDCGDLPPPPNPPPCQGDYCSPPPTQSGCPDGDCGALPPPPPGSAPSVSALSSSVPSGFPPTYDGVTSSQPPPAPYSDDGSGGDGPASPSTETIPSAPSSAPSSVPSDTESAPSSTTSALSTPPNEEFSGGVAVEVGGWTLLAGFVVALF